jgi:hypothetical protein
MNKSVLAVPVAVVLAAGVALAERPPEPREKADLVVVGTVKKVGTKQGTFGGDGVQTNYTAEVEVDQVDRGKGARAGETIKVTWFHVTKTPSRPLPGAYGHHYAIKAKEKARFWLRKGDKEWSVIYNSDGVEKLKK